MKSGYSLKEYNIKLHLENHIVPQRLPSPRSFPKEVSYGIYVMLVFSETRIYSRI